MNSPRKSSAVFLSAVAALLVAGCGTYEAPLTMPHVYTTDTQQANFQLTGVTIDYGVSSDAIAETAASTILLTNETVEYQIDGRLVGKHPLARNFSTFQQIPPGEHELLVQNTLQGPLGNKSGWHKIRFVFQIAPNQRANLSVVFGRSIGVDATLTDVISSQKTEDK